MSARKTVAQVGVLLYVSSFTLGLLALPYSSSLPVYAFIPMVIFEIGWIFVLLLAALIPSNKDEQWGSIWPLSGYDNAIDAIYTRGPWLIRFQELDELDRERGVSSGMTTIFGEEHS